MKKILIISVLLSINLFFLSAQQQQSIDLKVYAGTPVANVSSTMWGIFFEDINFGADGGLYAELVKNRSFEFPLPMTGWEVTGSDGHMLTSLYSPHNEMNPRYLTLVLEKSSTQYGIINEGFRGIGFREGIEYRFSVMARASSSDGVNLTVSFRDENGKVFSSSETKISGGDWKKYNIVIKCNSTVEKGSLGLLFSGTGRIDIDMVSLFPGDTWKGRENGLRKDLVQKLADLKPGFVRFPGGCIVEGRELTNRYQWKNTVGPVADRKLIMNRWNVEMKDHPAPDYFQSYGLGFFEYFLLSEDLGAEPLPILNCGMSCQFNAAEVVPLDELDPYIQDALDLIEFANGDVTSKWGALRASMGHPKPFNLHYIGVGNEQWEEQYIERYKVFEKILLEKYPAIKIISGAGPFSSGKYFDLAWKELRNMHPYVIDEHYYMSPEWFLKNAGRYDNYDRKGIKVFAGEFAAHWKEGEAPESRNTWYSALTEAAFMTGLERNADVVVMASYAPLLAHTDAWQWRPDLIWFNNLSSAASANYYVQKMFSNNKGNKVIKVLKNDEPLIGQDSLYCSGTIDTVSHTIIIKLINSSSQNKAVSFTVNGKRLDGKGKLELLKSLGKYTFNQTGKPEIIFPVKKVLPVNGKKINIAVDPLSVNVLVLGYKN